MAIKETLPTQTSEKKLRANLRLPMIESTPAVSYNDSPSTKGPVDLLQQLTAHIEQLEGLQGRLHFMVSEIQTLLRRS